MSETARARADLDFFLPLLYQCMGLREYKSWASYALTCYGFSTFMPFVCFSASETDDDAAATPPRDAEDAPPRRRRAARRDADAGAATQVTELRAKVLLAEETERNAAKEFERSLYSSALVPAPRHPVISLEDVAWMRMTESTSRHAFVYVFGCCFHESAILLPSYTSPKKELVPLSRQWTHVLGTYLAKVAWLSLGQQFAPEELSRQPTRSIANMADVVQRFGLSNSTCLLGTIYFERFVRCLGRDCEFLLEASTWFPLFMCCMLLAAKVTDDAAYRAPSP